MRQALYPKVKYPQGHPDLANSLSSLGRLLNSQGAHGEARGYCERALAMRKALYPKERYPQGHPRLAISLNNLGAVLGAQGAFGEARGYYERALSMLEALYPKVKYPQGHPELAASLNNLRALLQDQGAYGEARGCFERALAMYEALYPKERYPQGHPHLAGSLNNLGALLYFQGTYSEARAFLQRGVDMQQGLTDILLATTSEAEAANYLAHLPLIQDLLISVCLHVPGSDGANYARVWRGKAAVVRMLERRQAELFRQAAANPAAHRDIESWHEVRRQLARLLLATADGRDHPERVTQLRQLTADKERSSAT